MTGCQVRRRRMGQTGALIPDREGLSVRRTLSILRRRRSSSPVSRRAAPAPRAVVHVDAPPLDRLPERRRRATRPKSVKVPGDFGATPDGDVHARRSRPPTWSARVVIKGNGRRGQGRRLRRHRRSPRTTARPARRSPPPHGFDGQAPQTIQVDDKAFVPGLVRAVECLPVSSRVVLTATGEGRLRQRRHLQARPEGDGQRRVRRRHRTTTPPTRANGTPVAAAGRTSRR